MNYKDFTKEQLIERIEELEILNSELLKEKEEATRLEYAWTGNLGHWYWNFKTNKVTYNPLKVTALGYDKSEIPEQVTYEFLLISYILRTIKKLWMQCIIIYMGKQMFMRLNIGFRKKMENISGTTIVAK